MQNIINAIINLVSNPQIKLKNYSESHNRANNMGEALEEYIKDLFADSVGLDDDNVRNQKLSETFCYFGNQNNPPDSMLIKGDAIEVKKIESKNSSLALNSSYPKAKLYSDNPMINEACRSCENWDTRDMLYSVGIVNGSCLDSLAFVYGEDYCASKETYEKIRSTIKKGILSIPNVEFASTDELGRINKVDPLGITYLRVRGMWGIENPFKVFEYVYKRDFSKQFNFMCIINNDKYNTFANRSELEAIENSNLHITDIQIKNPDNPAKLKKAKLITFFVDRV